jgi:hypothetical protein
MPKKTKKEKLLTLYRKRIRLLENKREVAFPTASPATPSPVPSIPVSSVQKPAAEKEVDAAKTGTISPEQKQLDQYFFSDLKKSLILITLIIGLEISLYFVKLIK